MTTDKQRREKLIKWLDKLLKQLRALTVSTYYRAIEELRDRIAAREDFVWNENGTEEKRIMNLLKILEGKINFLIASGVSKFYAEGLLNAADQINKALENDKFKYKKTRLNKLRASATESRRQEAVAGHAETVSYRGGAMNNLSNRVWDFKDQSKKQIEAIVQDAISKGQSVNDAKNSVKEFLNTDDKGNMKHGGEPGVYKSPEKNCARLIRTEVNAAYRSAEIDSYQKSDMVLGFKIFLSGNHYTKRGNKPPKELHDICDELVGEYPKEFYWTGWHPNCRCIIVPITMTPAQFGEYMDAEDEGREKEYLDSIRVKDYPPNFKKYFASHADKLAKNPPQWVKNNTSTLPKLPQIPTAKPSEKKEEWASNKNTSLSPQELQRQRDFNAGGDTKQRFRAFKKNEEKSIKQKGKFIAKNPNYFTGEICMESGEIESVMYHCYNELEVNAAKQIHNILPTLKNGKRVDLKPDRDYQKKVEKGYLYYVYYDVNFNGVDFVLECKVMNQGTGEKEYPYSFKEKENQ